MLIVWQRYKKICNYKIICIFFHDLKYSTALLVKQLIDNEVNITITPFKGDDGEIYFKQNWSEFHIGEISIDFYITADFKIWGDDLELIDFELEYVTIYDEYGEEVYLSKSHKDAFVSVLNVCAKININYNK